MEELRTKLEQAIEEYGIGDKRTISISQELDELVYKSQKKLIKPKKDLIWMACTNDKYQLPVVVGNTAKELGELLGVSSQAIENAVYRGGKSKGFNIVCVDISSEVMQ